MRYLTTIVAVLSVAFLGLIAGMVVRGWDATPQSLTSRDDALSVCVRSIARREISPLKFPACIALTFTHVEKQELIESALQLERQLDEDLRRLDETRKGFQRFMDPSQETQGEQQSI